MNIKFMFLVGWGPPGERQLFMSLVSRVAYSFPPSSHAKKSADVVKGQNERYYGHWKRINEGITPVVVKDVDRPSIIV
jgi:hypothetical protein